MNGNTIRRLQIEYQSSLQLPQVASVELINDNALNWGVILRGPQGSAYEGLELPFILTIPLEYPFKAPEVTFQIPLFHPNVEYNTGRMCSGILSPWAPEMTINDCVNIMCHMFNEPSLSSPLNEEAAWVWQNDKNQFWNRVRNIN
eukprot:TRINITY_DN5275_c0_g1_i3.p1 TRINITY_DN5275_c0_g1~~TRINITY_DN5275_c0_g1_i3.p1  ORF type:complete len:145 (-),score=21.59 TRINITY_DN5275_c0_g1_i3:70-504(-)